MSDDDFQWQNPSARNMRDDSVYEGEVIGGGLSDWSKFVTHLMDDLIKVPGTNLGIGLDGLLGLIPCVGDAATTVTSGSLFFEAIRNRVPLVVIARMALNIIIDALLGAIPLIGDVADIAHKANRKNLKLINKAIEDRDQAVYRALRDIYREAVDGHQIPEYLGQAARRQGGGCWVVA